MGFLTVMVGMIYYQHIIIYRRLVKNLENLNKIMVRKEICRIFVEIY
jgi:hypothetical protein